MLMKDKKENILVQNNFLVFSYFSALEISPSRNSVDYSLTKRKFQCNPQFCKHVHI